jgi:uncharacterized protein (DUF2267 family)
MAVGDPDPHQDANFQSLVDALAREGLPRRAEAARSVEAVICALAQRTADEHFEELRERLPSPFRGQLSACERHAATPDRKVESVEDFYAIVAEDLDRDPDEIEPTVRAVFAALRAQTHEAEAEEIEAQLPVELVPLWRRPS